MEGAGLSERETITYVWSGVAFGEGGAVSFFGHDYGRRMELVVGSDY